MTNPSTPPADDNEEMRILINEVVNRTGNLADLLDWDYRDIWLRRLVEHIRSLESTVSRLKEDNEAMGKTVAFTFEKLRKAAGESLDLKEENERLAKENADMRKAIGNDKEWWAKQKAGMIEFQEQRRKDLDALSALNASEL